MQIDYKTRELTVKLVYYGPALSGKTTNLEAIHRLIDPQFQRTVARAVLDGVNTYFSNQPPPGTLFAARAMAERQGGQRGEVSGGSP